MVIISIFIGRLPPRLRFACIFDHFNVTELGTLQPATLLLDTWDARSSVISALYTVHRLMAAPVYPKVGRLLLLL
jgi:hypothetical protein